MLRSLLRSLGLPVGSVFLIITLLCPLNIEATLWVSAATRIVSGLFFGVLSAHIAQKGRGLLSMALFFLVNLFSLLFYEQAAVFTFLLVVLISVCKGKKSFSLIAGLNGLAVAGFYYAFRNYGVFFSRLSSADLLHTASGVQNILTCAKSCVYTLFPDIWLCVFFAVAGLLLRTRYCNGGYSFYKLIFGVAVLVLTLFPLSVFKGYNIPFRCLLVPLVGIAVVMDCIAGERLYRILCIALVAVFISSGIYEFVRFDRSTKYDESVVEAIASEVGKGQNVSLSLYGTKAYYEPSLSNHAEHIASVTSSDWAITGALRAKLSNPYFPMVTFEGEGDIKVYFDDTGTKIKSVQR